MQDSQKWIPLHGDLHHGNILSAKREPWLSIDPKGVLGPIEFDYGCFLRNPFASLLANQNLYTVLNSRIDHIAELANLEKEKLHLWSFAQSVLASIWALEDGQKNWKAFL